MCVPSPGFGNRRLLARLLLLTHNSFLPFVLDQGMLGIALFAFALAFSAHHAWRRKDEFGNLRFIIS